MCRASYLRADRSPFYWTLPCSTDADELYEFALAIARGQDAVLWAIEPCLAMFSSAITPAPLVERPAE